MLVEIGWFIGLPIVREIASWWQHRQHSRPLVLLRSLLVFSILLAVLLVPWRSSVEIPAMLEAARVSTLYAPTPAQISQRYVSNGQSIQAGQLLLELVAPDLNSRLTIVRQQIAILQLQLRRQAARRETIGDSQILEQRLAESLAEYRGLVSQQQRLQIRAPQAGTVRDLATDLTPGRWIAPELALLRVVETGSGRIRGYLREDNLHRLKVGESGRFIADDPAWPAIPVRLDDIDPTGVPYLQLETLASDHSGPIAVRRDEQQRPQPVQAHYGARLTVDANAALPDQPLRGVVVVEGKAESLFTGIWRRLAALGVRESGF